HINYDANDDRTDDVTLVALVQGWPIASWRSLLARAEHQAGRLRSAAARSGGQLTLVRTASELDRFLERRGGDRTLVAGILAIEGSIAHAVSVVGAEHVALGSDFDGAVSVPFDASGMGLVTAALLGQGLGQDQIAAVMGGSAIRLLRSALPPA